MQRYSVVPVYGEANSIYHVVDNAAPEDEQPAIVASYDTLGACGVGSRRAAERRAAELNNRENPARLA